MEKKNIVILFFPLAPFDNLTGVILMIIVYFASNMYFRKCTIKNKSEI